MTSVLERPAAVLVAVSRPWFWPVSWVPAYLGTVLASHAWLPGRADAGRAMVALLVLGPLVWGAVLAQNDLQDLRSDRLNPRKATAPLVTGALSARRLRVAYRVVTAAALASALVVGPLFVLGVAGVLVLGWAYSVPPLRLKTRPGWDVAVNALVVGVVSPAAGWAITRTPWEFPWQFAVIASARDHLETVYPMDGSTRRAKSILSWALTPTDCNYTPIWGNALNYRIRLDQ